MAKLRVGNQDVEGEYVAFTPISEDWSEYRVGNYIVKTKLVVSDILQVKDQFDQQGNPVFFLQWTNPVTIRKAE